MDAGRRTHQQQRGHVDGRDQQHQASHAHDHKERLPEIVSRVGEAARSGKHEQTASRQELGNEIGRSLAQGLELFGPQGVPGGSKAGLGRRH